MAIWKITCPKCEYCEEIRIDIDNFPEKEQKEFLDRIRGKNKEIVLKIPFDELDKLQYALDHIQLIEDGHIDDVLDTLFNVKKRG